MFSVSEQTARMHFHSRSEKSGNERIPAATLAFKYHAPNDVLSEFSPDLKASLYRRPFERSEEHTSELQSLIRITYAVFCLKKNKILTNTDTHNFEPTPQMTNVLI